MLDTEAVVWQAVVCEEFGVFAQSALKMLMFSTHGVQLVQESLICHCAWPQTLLIQHGQNPILVLKTNYGYQIKHIILKLRFKHVCKLWEQLYDSLLLKTDKMNRLYDVVIYLLRLTHWKSHALASVLQNKVYAVFASIFHEVYIEEILRITVTKTHSNKLSQLWTNCGLQYL